MLALVEDRSQVAELRRAAVELAQRGGFDEPSAARVALVATEMATNLLKHAGRGQVLIEGRVGAPARRLDLIALDQGPGIADLRRALEDGTSTAGSPGTGLGAIRRQADEFAIWSRPGQGTAVLARFGPGTKHARVDLGAVAEPLPGEIVCGDSWCFSDAEVGPSLLMVDGSGHGAAAALAADAAVQAFQEGADLEPVRRMERIHRALAPTRGAAVAIATVDRSQRLVRFVGVGNIGAALSSGGTVKRMVSHNGTAGHVAPRIREFTYPFEALPTVILHSDGISARWDLASYPGLVESHPALIAALVFRDHRRGKDDASVAAMRLLS